jgi:histidine ammonia-lyase
LDGCGSSSLRRLPAAGENGGGAENPREEAKGSQGATIMVAHQKNRISEEFWHSIERPAEMVREYPVSSMLLMFGLGMGVGVLLSQPLSAALAEIIEEPSMTEKMKRNVVDALSHVLSPSMLKQLKDYTA